MFDRNFISQIMGVETSQSPSFYYDGRPLSWFKEQGIGITVTGSFAIMHLLDGMCCCITMSSDEDRTGGRCMQDAMPDSPICRNCEESGHHAPSSELSVSTDGLALGGIQDSGLGDWGLDDFRRARRRADQR